MAIIKDIFDERTKYPMKENGDPLLEHMLDREDPCCFIVPDHVLWDETFHLFVETHNIAGIFYLDRVMLNFLNKFTLILTSKEPTSVVKIGQFDETPYNFIYKILMPSEGSLVLPEEYSVEYEKYLSGIESWINGGSRPQDGDVYSFNEIKTEDIVPGQYNALYYSKSAFKCREIIKQELTVSLIDVADVFIPEHIMEDDAYGVKLTTKRYPFCYSEQDNVGKSTIQLHKGDILIPRKWFDKVYLLDVEPEEQLYATTLDAVIRCKKILPEYLYLYLNSDVAKCMITYFEGTFLKPLEKGDLEKLPIIVPRLEDGVYQNDFKILTSDKREYGGHKLKKELAEYYQNIHDANYPVSNARTFEEILNIELAKKIKARNRKILRPFLTEDIKELNTCFNGGAYKATLILAGSIMEAILIDWLSEIDHRNYFISDYRVYEDGKSRRADLKDYIDAIEEIKRPSWMAEAKNAHEIRKKRNLVHAKLCLKEDVAINKSTCKIVIDYLKQIIRSRSLL